MKKSWVPWLACADTVVAAPAALAETTVIQNPGAGSNRIEVTGNRAENVRVRCGPDGRGPATRGVNVNSVDVDGRALQGRTIIITGRNTRDADTQVDCPKQAHDDGSGQVNVNSVNIR